MNENNSSTTSRDADTLLIKALTAAIDAKDFDLIVVSNTAKPAIVFKRGMPHDLFIAAGNHPDFVGFREKFFGEQQVLLQADVIGLMRRALTTTPEEAVAWLHGVYDKDVADFLLIAEVFGIGIDQRLKFPNGVELVQVSDLPPSQLTRELQFQAAHDGGVPFTPSKIFAVYQIKGIKAATEPTRERQLDRGCDEINRVVDALTLLDQVAPAVGAAWLQFSDPDLDAFRGWMATVMANHDGIRPTFATYSVSIGDIAKVARYFDLPTDCAKHTLVATRRLNLARRRISPGDKAIDGCIALESIFSDETDALSHKVAVRVARYLESDYQARLTLKGQAKAFYRLRSQVVHGGKSKPKANENPTDVAYNGLRLCSRVLQKIVADRCLPNLDELDLGPAQSCDNDD